MRRVRVDRSTVLPSIDGFGVGMDDITNATFSNV